MDKEATAREYLGKHYGEGSSGCFLFVKAFYKEKFNIEMMNDYLEMLTIFIPVKEPRIGDLVLVKNHPIVINHIGVFLGDGEFMHGGAFKDRSEVVVSRVWEPPYDKRVVGYLRHPGAKI